MLQIVLYEPEIPPNTGNIARLCAATEVHLHLIEPLGFSLEDRYLKRAGLDYWPHVHLQVWPTLAAYLAGPGRDQRIIASSSRQGVAMHSFVFSHNDTILLGPETRGLPASVLEQAHAAVRIPIWGNVRSLNLSTAAGVLLYTALAQTGVLDTAEAAVDEV